MSQIRRMSSLSGVLFAAFMLVALLLDNTPEADKTAKWNAYFSSHGNQVRAVVSAYLWVAAGIALLGFLLVLRERMNGRMHPFSLITGAFAAAGMCIGGGLWGSVGGTVLFGNGPAPSGEVAVFITGLAYPVIMLSAMLPLALCLLSTGVVAVRTRALPLWIGWFAAVVGVLLLFAVVWLPMLAAILFGLVVGIALAARPAVPATTLATPAPA